MPAKLKRQPGAVFFDAESRAVLVRRASHARGRARPSPSGTTPWGTWSAPAARRLR